MSDKRKRETVGGVSFDRSYWPKAGASVTVPFDLSDLWETDEDALLTLVAEALLNEPPNVFLTFDGPELGAVCYLWEVGGDCLTATASLRDLLEHAVHDYDEVRSDPQAEDVASRIAKLDATAAALQRSRGFLQAQLDAFNAKYPEGRTLEQIERENTDAPVIDDAPPPPESEGPEPERKVARPERLHYVGTEAFTKIEHALQYQRAMRLDWPPEDLERLARMLKLLA